MFSFKKIISVVLSLFFATAFILPLAAKEQSVGAYLVNSTAIETTLPFEILEGKKWKAASAAEYVKVHIYLDRPVQVGQIYVESCGPEFAFEATSFINFTGVVETMSQNETKTALSVIYKGGVEARSITINFEKNTNLCIQNFSVYDPAEKKIEFVLPERIGGDISVSHKTNESYEAMNLFDSRFEYAFSPVPEDKKREIEFHFQKSVRMSGLIIWNGYQRSAVHCVRNGRVREALLTGDNNFSEKITFKDIMDPQRIEFQNEFRGKNLKVKILSVYRGKMFEDPVISELRFLDGDHVFMIDSLGYMRQIRKTNTARLSSAGFKELLDKNAGGAEEMFSREWGRIDAKVGLNMRLKPSTKSKVVVMIPSNKLVEIIEKHKEKVVIGGKKGRWVKVKYGKKTGWVFDAYLRLARGESRTGEWNLRLRGDGSLYMDGNSQTLNYNDEQETKIYYILGNYRIIKTSKNEIEMVFFGLLRIKSRVDYLSEDCNGCGHDCNLLGKEREDSSREIVFVERVKLIRVTGNPDKKYEIINMTPEPTLGFKSIIINDNGL